MASSWGARAGHRVFSALSWRMERRADGRPVERTQRMRSRFGQLLYYARAHQYLPDTTDRAAILCFHGVVEKRTDPDIEANAIDVKNFRKVLRVLNRSFAVLSLAEMMDLLKSKQPPPPRSVAITFDDGYENNCTIAAAELDAVNMPWSVFLAAQLVEDGQYPKDHDVALLIRRGSRSSLSIETETESMTYDLRSDAIKDAAHKDIVQRFRYAPPEVLNNVLQQICSQYSADELFALRDRYTSARIMTWEQAAQLLKAGVDIGNHTLHHLALAPQTPEVIRQEIVGGRDLIRARLGAIGPHFAYPYGSPDSYSDVTANILRKLGYEGALTTDNCLVSCPVDDMIHLPRLIVPPRSGQLLSTLWRRFNR